MSFRPPEKSMTQPPPLRNRRHSCLPRVLAPGNTEAFTFSGWGFIETPQTGHCAAIFTERGCQAGLKRQCQGSNASAREEFAGRARPFKQRNHYFSSLKGLKTLNPGRLKSRSLPVTIVNPCRRAVAAM